MNFENFNSNNKIHDHSINNDHDVCMEAIRPYNKNPIKWSNYLKKQFELHKESDRIDEFINFIHKTKQKETILILDAGCGAGHSTNYLKSQGFDPIGIDLSEGLLNQAKKNYGYIEDCFNNDDIRTLANWKDNQFDVIFVSYAIIHIPKRQIPQTFDSLNRVLKRNGYFYFSLNFTSDEKGFENPKDKHPIDTEPVFRNIFSEKEIIEELRRINFIKTSKIFTRKADPDESPYLKCFFWGKKY